jgi:hypothetical protein
MTYALIDTYILQCRTDIDRVSSVSGTGRSKLRTYKLLKTDHEVETRCKLQLPYAQNSASAKFGCGVAPLRIETLSYVKDHLNLQYSVSIL